ncbi:hypothetical protein [Streptomyces boluensis]|uniref:Uncharacterized protein n=1 Tax=Streptomyces boluensis TaxID=1775135 RepID=A0A964XNZ2_9ACTN|nr:hypothetical protein [Streptomyces boluensis]NBE54681.1 hypothetical protein [Streptomyces boluensis]
MNPVERPQKTDDESARVDVAMLFRYGLGAHGPHRAALFGEGAVGAAVLLDRMGVLPRSVAFLGKTVRAGGVGYAARLPELLPGREATELVRGWLESAAQVAQPVEGDEVVARWLESVAELIGLRRTARERVGR